MRSVATTRFVARFARAGSVMESTTIRAGIDTDTRIMVNNVELTSNFQIIWKFDVSSTLLTIILVSVSIPALMVVLSMTLPARANRATNLVVATLLIPFSVFNAAGATWEWAAFYGLSIGIEVLILAFILRSAWTWPRTYSDAADVATADRLQQQSPA